MKQMLSKDAASAGWFGYVYPRRVKYESVELGWSRYRRIVIRVLTLAFWVAAPICAVALAASTFGGRVGPWLLWVIGISLIVVMLCSGGIAWLEFRQNPLGDTERGEWTNTMLFFAIVFTITFFVAFLYLPTLYFAR